MKKYIGFVLLTFSTQLTLCEDVIEKTIQEVNPQELQKLFASNLVLRASDKERYVKLAREMVDSLRNFKDGDGATPAEQAIKKRLTRGQTSFFMLLGGLMLVWDGLRTTIKDGPRHDVFAQMIQCIFGPSIFFLGTMITAVSLIRLSENTRAKVAIKACAILKILEDVPVAKD